MNLTLHLLFLVFLDLDGVILGLLMGNWLVGFVASNTVFTFAEFIYFLQTEKEQK